MLKVQSRMCSSCIYRKDSALDVTELERQIADPRMHGHFRGSRLCHHAPDRPRRAQVVCRGFWNKHKDRFDAGQIAQRLDLVEFVHVDRFAAKPRRKAPMTTLRPELKPRPARIARLPLDKRGYPIPWFVAILDDGEPEFRAMDGRKLVIAIRDRRCWVCGDRLGAHLAFPIGPMCAVNRVTAEPPNHYECARWSVENCPFLTRPHMVRREDEFTAALEADGGVSGHMIKRNPGATAIWVTRTYDVFDDGKGKPLIKIGPAECVEWYAEGRRATRAEVLASIESGFPLLDALCDNEITPARREAARTMLRLQRQAVEAWLP